jgi:hypothetical protein
VMNRSFGSEMVRLARSLSVAFRDRSLGKGLPIPR